MMPIKNNSNKIMLQAFLALYVFVRIILTQIVVVCPEGTNFFQSTCFTNCNISTIKSQSNNTIGQGIQQLYYVTLGVSVCTQDCSSQCQTCDTYSDNCISCPQIDYPNFVLFSKCYSACPETYFQNYTTLACDYCAKQIAGCANCSINLECEQYGGSYNCSAKQQWICLTCDPGEVMFYQSGTNFKICLSSVPDGYINLLGVATACNSKCLTCSQFVWNCSYCLTLIYHNSQCISQCPISHFNKTISISFNANLVQTQICTLCETPCQTCLSKTQCLSCLTGFYFSPLTLQCLDSNSCPITTYPNNTNYQCQACVFPCRRCINIHQCQQCLSGYLYEGGCQIQCPILTYQSQVNDSLSQNNTTLLCNYCVPPCEQCLNSTSCLTCIDSTIIYYYSVNLSCLYGCPNQYFKNKITMTCQQCPQYCETCNDVQCFSCTQINSSDVYYFSKGKCLTQCKNSYFPSFSITLICESCPSECLTCFNLTFCTSCIVDFFLIENSNSSKVCEPSCPSPYFVQAENSLGQLICSLCSDLLCQKCTSKDYCYICVTSYNSSTGDIYDNIALFRGKCYLDCQLPYEKVQNKLNSSWTCQIPQTYVNLTQGIPLVKGIIVTSFIPFLGSYASAGVTISVLIIFLIIRCNQTQKGLFFVMLSAIISLPESYVVIVMGYSHFMYHLYQFIERFDYNILSIILFGCFLFYIILSIVNVYLFVKVTSSDKSYQEWKKHNSICSYIFFVIANSISLINFKFHNILWSKFGSLPVLEQISKLNYYNAICGIGIFPTLGILICCGFSYLQEEQIKTIYLDAIIVLSIQTILMLISLKRPKDLFIFHLKQDSDDSLSNSKRQLHRRIVQSDQIIGTAIKPSGIQINEQYLNKKIYQDMNTQLLTSNRDMYLTECQKSSSNFQSERMFLQGTVSKNKMIRRSQKKKSQIIFDMNNSQNSLFYPNNSLAQSQVQFQRTDHFVHSDSNQNLLMKEPKDIHKSHVKLNQFCNIKFKENILSKSQLIDRNRMNLSQQSKSQASDRLNDAISSIEQGTDRGQQGSIQQSQQQQNLSQKLQVIQKSIKKTLKSGKQQKGTFAHNQKQHYVQEIQVQSFQQIKILDFLDSQDQNDNFSDRAVFQQSVDQPNICENVNQQFIINQQQFGNFQGKNQVMDDKNQVGDDKNQVKDNFIATPKQQQYSIKELKQSSLKRQSFQQQQSQQQYFGGYSIDNSMGSIRYANNQDQQMYSQNVSQQQKQKLSIRWNQLQNNISNQLKLKQSAQQLKQGQNNLNNKEDFQDNQALQLFQYQERQVQVKNQQLNNKRNANIYKIEQNQLANNKKQKQLHSSIKGEYESDSIINSKGTQIKYEEVKGQLERNKTIQISQDQFNKEGLDIIPLVFDQGNYQHSDSSIIYKETQNQVNYVYNDFTINQRQKFISLDNNILPQKQLESNSEQIPNNLKISHQNQQNQKHRNQQFIQFRIKTTLKHNKVEYQKKIPINLRQKKQQVLIIEDKKFKKLKRQLKQLERQQSKQKALLQNINQLSEIEKAGLNKQTRINSIQREKSKDRKSLSRQTKIIKANKSVQKHNRNDSIQKIDREREIQKIYKPAHIVKHKNKGLNKNKSKEKTQLVQNLTTIKGQMQDDT